MNSLHGKIQFTTDSGCGSSSVGAAVYILLCHGSNTENKLGGHTVRS